MNHVARMIGGLNSQQKHVGQNGVPAGIVERTRTAQQSILNSLLSARVVVAGPPQRIIPSRLERMTEQVALAGPAAYSPVEFLTEQRTMINNALQGGGTRDEVTKQHLRDASDEIATILAVAVAEDRDRDLVAFQEAQCRIIWSA